MKTIICNEFSLHMLHEKCSLIFDRISFQKFKEIVASGDYIACIGDENIANRLCLEYNKSNIILDENTRLIVAKSINNDSEFEFYDIKYDRCL